LSTSDDNGMLSCIRIATVIRVESYLCDLLFRLTM
jgi:hypothetical protein